MYCLSKQKKILIILLHLNTHYYTHFTLPFESRTFRARSKISIMLKEYN